VISIHYKRLVGGGMEKVKVTRSRTGLPVMAEKGGGNTTTGWCHIICGGWGEKLKPLFVPSKGYCNADHALFVVKPGMYIIQGSRDRTGVDVSCYVIDSVGTPEDPDEIVYREEFSYGEGDGNIPDYLQAAVEACKRKCYCYHCRCAHYIIG